MNTLIQNIFLISGCVPSPLFGQAAQCEYKGMKPNFANVAGFLLSFFPPFSEIQNY